MEVLGYGSGIWIRRCASQPGDITATIREDADEDLSGPSDTIFATLTRPADVTTDGIRRFSAPSGLTLAASTTYWVHVQRNSGSFEMSGTFSNSEDSGGSDGWSIADFYRQMIGEDLALVVAIMRIRVNGFDTVAPTIAEVSVTSEPQTDDGDDGRVYGLGENIELTVRFDEPVTVTGTPTFGFSLTDEGALISNIVLAAYVRGAGTDSLVFAYRVRLGDSDDNGIHIFSNRLSLDEGTIRDAAENDADLEHEGISDSLSDHRVDAGLAPAPERRAHGVPTDWGLTPEGLGTGRRFRLLFVSSTTRRGDSTDIEDYNAFVRRDAAGGHEALV